MGNLPTIFLKCSVVVSSNACLTRIKPRIRNNVIGIGTSLRKCYSHSHHINSRFPPHSHSEQHFYSRSTGTHWLPFPCTPVQLTCVHRQSRSTCCAWRGFSQTATHFVTYSYDRRSSRSQSVTGNQRTGSILHYTN